MITKHLDIVACNDPGLKRRAVVRNILETPFPTHTEQTIAWEDWVHIHKTFSLHIQELGFKRIYPDDSSASSDEFGGIYVNRKAGLVVKRPCITGLASQYPEMRIAIIKSPLYCPALLLENTWEIQRWLKPIPKQARYIKNSWSLGARLMSEREPKSLRRSFRQVADLARKQDWAWVPAHEDVKDPVERALAVAQYVILQMHDVRPANVRVGKDGRLYIIDI